MACDLHALCAGLQSPEAQQLLAELARCPAIRLLASMDHVNAPLLWDRRTAAHFNWLHFDVTTYAPYHVEAQEMPSLLIGRRCIAALLLLFTVPYVRLQPVRVQVYTTAYEPTDAEARRCHSS